MKVLSWVPAPVDTSPGQRFRIEEWYPYLRDEGIDIEFVPFADEQLSALLKRPGHTFRKAAGVSNALVRRLRHATSVRADLVHIFREDALLGPALPMRILTARGIPFVYDFDDAVWLDYRSPTNPLFSHLRCSRKTAVYCRLARQVLAGNDTLRAYAEAAGGTVSIVPTTIETRTYVVPTRVSANTVPVIGWTGSHSTEPYLEQLRPVFEQLGRTHAFRLVVIGGARFQLSGVQVEHRTWCSATEVADLSDIDVGVMPLPDADWERGKCGLKALQYMALAIAPIVSPVGVNSSIVEHGVTGLVARSPEDWRHALERLMTDADLRHRLGRAARQRVEREYSATVHGPRVARLLREAARGPAPRARLRSLKP